MAAGAIVGLPTDTVYGIGVVPRPETLRALITAKGRAGDKGIALLIDGLDQVDGLVRMGPLARRLGERFWPGPLTLVLPLQRAELVPEALTGGRHTLALRLPDHSVPRALARQLGPIAVTSANRSGEPEARTARELVASLGASVAIVLDDGPVRGGVPSSVVAVDAEDHVSLLREGAVPSAEIWSLLDEG
jgi:tRNA threonylcarbamoyl adenosine modification protein (Sua5/YciO/YrdC/YwlC family)